VPLVGSGDDTQGVYYEVRYRGKTGYVKLEHFYVPVDYTAAPEETGNAHYSAAQLAALDVVIKGDRGKVQSNTELEKLYGDSECRGYVQSVVSRVFGFTDHSEFGAEMYQISSLHYEAYAMWSREDDGALSAASARALLAGTAKGDVCQMRTLTAWHSFVFLGHMANGIAALDANFFFGDMAVRIHEFPYAYLTAAPDGSDCGFTAYRIAPWRPVSRRHFMRFLSGQMKKQKRGCGMGGGAFYTGEYGSRFEQFGFDRREAERRLDRAFETVFHGSEDERLYHECGDDMAYFVDTGNNDARTEGMSYAMMMCVQMDRKDEFDRLWRWTKKYMYMDSGVHAGYFAWSIRLDGAKNSTGPAPDGEEYFALALFFAERRWGGGEAPLNYAEQARAILRACLHNGENGVGYPMWDPASKLIKFVPEAEYTDPSYHLPHFYELFALWADEGDRPFWREAARASRLFLHKACHPVTGLAPDCTNFDGTPLMNPRRDIHYSDAYRVATNIGMDWMWFGVDAWQKDAALRIQRFFWENEPEQDYKIYHIDGTPAHGDPSEFPWKFGDKAMHPVAIIATNAAAALAADGAYARRCVELFWNTPLRTGARRYYDNCLYFFALLALSGHYRIW